MAGVAQTSHESNLPRITYHATNRTFDRLFRETSLTEMKQVVRRKLGLAGNEVVLLSQIRSGKLIDLEDDDDFDAFRALAHSAASVDVRVTVEASSGVQTPEVNQSLSTPNEESSDQASSGGRKRKVVLTEAEAESPHEDMQGTLPPSKRRRANTTSGPKLYISKPVELVSETQTSQPFQKTNLSTTSATPASSTENVRPATLLLPTPAPTQRMAMNQIEGPTPSGTTEPQTKKSKRKKAIKSSEIVEEEAQVPNPTQREASITEKKKRKKKKKDGELQEAEVKLSKTATQASKSIEIERTNQGRFPEELATAISKTRDLADKESENPVKSNKPTKSKGTEERAIKESTEQTNDMDIDPSGPSTSSGIKILTAKTMSGRTTSKTTKSRGKTGAEAPVDNMDTSQSQTPGLKRHRHSATDAELDACARSIRDLIRQKTQSSTSSAASALAKTSTPELPKKTVHQKPVSQKKITTSTRTELESPESDDASQIVPAKGPTQSKTPVVPPSQKRPAPDSDSDDSLKAISLAAKRKYTEHAEESSSKINIQDVLQGPTKRHITIDNALQVDIAGQHDTQDVVLEEEQVEKTRSRRRFSGARRAGSSSDSEMEVGGDAGGDDDPSDLDVSSIPSKTPSVPPGIQCVSASNQEVPNPSNSKGPTAKKSSLFASSVPASGRDAEATVLESFSMASDAAEAPPQVGKAVAKVIEGATSLGSPRGSGDDIDPIEPTITTREGSPIEPASQLPRNSPVSPVISRMKKRGGKSQDIPTPVLVPKVPSHRGRPSKTQPVTSHETAIRDSVVKMTRSRSKLSTTNAPITEPRKVSAKPTQSDNSDTEEEGQEITPKARSQKSSSENSRSESVQASPKQLSQATWTALPVSSPTEPDTVSMVDELQSTPGHDVRLEDPLFIPSETQPGFPFSQYQDMETQSINDLPHSPDDSDDEEEVVQSVTTQIRRPSNTSTFRGLSQIASQPRGQKFGASPLPSSQPVRPKPRATEDLYGRAAMDSGESDSDSESDAGISHIPKSRRAGKRKA
ncbi:hypothetical protein Moror_6750 [Moniliophthora roreri MCA 2997]|uniref:Uncharacterized protein n=1 Tax=Moniliophthora roreri (strain MCA 2997) TaxID=1381753 RepID=V2XSG2_MONRO|nr:hypothetical protein Moror_6750 [Moniliophthora roreri MCA 2997]